MEFLQQEGFELVLGWEFYVPLLFALVLIAFAVPVWAVLGVTSISMLYFSDVLPLGLVGEALFDGIDAFALIAVPLFILTGDVLVRTGLSNKLLNVAEALVGGFRSGFGTATVLVCGFFACISGSDAAGAAGVGRMTIDRLVEQGYPKPYACALVAAGACTGILIPPSIAYIIIGLIQVFVQTSMGCCLRCPFRVTGAVYYHGRDLQRYLHTYRSGSSGGHNHHYYRPVYWQYHGIGFPQNAGELGQGQRRDRAYYRLFPAAGTNACGARDSAGICVCDDLFNG